MDNVLAKQIFMEDNVINAKMGLNFILIVQHVVVIPKDPMELLAAMMDNAGAKLTLKE